MAFINQWQIGWATILLLRYHCIIKTNYILTFRQISIIGTQTQLQVVNIFIQMSNSFKDITEQLINVNKLFSKINRKFSSCSLPKKAGQALHDIKDSLATLNKLSAEVDWAHDLDSKQNVDVVKIQPGMEKDSHVNREMDNLSSISITEKCIVKDERQEQLQKSSEKQSRGPYRQYSAQVKQNVISLHRQGIGYSKISKMLCIPSKNVIRWCRNGADRKPGAGRKVLDPEMEEKLNKWIREYFVTGSSISNVLVRQKAKQLTRHGQFFASLGWLKNFIKRYDLKKMYKFT